MKIMMDPKSNKWLGIKAVLFLVIFLILHYAYDWTQGNAFFELISGTDESMYQHMKIAFYGYLILSLVEFFVVKAEIDDRKQFVFTQLLGTILVPWMIFLVWYIPAAFLGQFESIVVEIIWANIATLGALFCTAIIQRACISLDFDTPLKVVIIALLLISVLEFTLFTFKLPWTDVFVEPEF